MMASLVNFLAATDMTSADSGIASVISAVQDIVNHTVMPIIYVVLGIFLVIKGALLGMQIVKAADEPQVRQEKINSLKWLIIGVAIAYGIAGAAHILTNYLDTLFGVNGKFGSSSAS